MKKQKNYHFFNTKTFRSVSNIISIRCKSPKLSNASTKRNKETFFPELEGSKNQKSVPKTQIQIQPEKTFKLKNTKTQQNDQNNHYNNNVDADFNNFKQHRRLRSTPFDVNDDQKPNQHTNPPNNAASNASHENALHTTCREARNNISAFGKKC